ncbi:WD-repeat protein [Leptomonas pyrrhocoris]|uniref:Pre-mRNA-processing factor 19 n=1 Tax=Leptomonas pyrrhocoris TaxID=157538 RepID=A0A0N0DYI2_LEPPY|nr:WD-repeat protein [Leptomonas pyrrhocoris]XP_015662625.1 WD-repeat protein [Leptomonas pyrrhocoris]KPA84185.1 WD-repeat protein [Leptomonas pyrrhocoris]KPA84186.1 WD-repeat protein [Leptomonas pyrrhocoris]|eukprot:XP_015662624.1 WD-repeat protein [Leptomonas pyrrhocoris]
MIRCNICQRVPQHPVVSVKSGHIFERTLIETYIDEHGRCPVTGQPLRREDLVPVQGATPDTTVASSGSLGAASVPTLLERLQAEWEGVALEQFALRQQVTQMQLELAHALQQYDAACHVIAKLNKELTALRGEDGGAAGAHDDAPAVDVPPALLRAMDEVEAAERKSRKQRKSAAAAFPQSLAEEAQWTLDASHASAVRVAVSADGASVYVSQITGDHAVVRYGLGSLAEECRGVGHTAAVHTIATAPDAALSAAEDGTVRVWRAKGAALHCAHTLRYAGGVAAMSQRMVGGAYALCGAPDGSLYLSDVEQGAHVVVTAPLVQSSGGLSCVELHPYSSLAVAATQPEDVQLWDMRAMAPNTMIALPQSGATKRVHVASASFSADCVSLAAGLSDGSTYVWDLRQVSSPVAVLPPNPQSIPATVRYSMDGRTLAVAGAGLSLYTSFNASSASAEPTLTTGAANAAMCDVCWTPNGVGLVGGSVDGVVRLYSTSV